MTEAQFAFCYGICADPIHPLNFWVGDISSIRYVDTATDTVSLVAGSQKSGCFADGIGEAAEFDVVYDLVCTRAGDRLIVADLYNHRLRSVDIKSKEVTTLAGSGRRSGRNDSYDGVGPNAGIRRPLKLTFDRSPLIEAESALYLTSYGGIRRFDLTTTAVTTPQWVDTGMPRWMDLWGIDSTPSGHLIVSCLLTHAIYLFDPRSAKRELLAGTGVPKSDYADEPDHNARFQCPYDVAVVDHAQCVFVAYSTNRRIRCITLPKSLFA